MSNKAFVVALVEIEAHSEVKTGHSKILLLICRLFEINK